MYWNVKILPGYIKCDFGSDFSQKWLISRLCYSLKSGMNYHIKHFEVLILALQGFFSSFGHNPSLYDVPKPNSGIYSIFVKKSKKCTIEFDLKLD